LHQTVQLQSWLCTLLDTGTDSAARVIDTVQAKQSELRSLQQDNQQLLARYTAGQNRAVVCNSSRCGLKCHTSASAPGQVFQLFALHYASTYGRTASAAAANTAPGTILSQAVQNPFAGLLQTVTECWQQLLHSVVNRP